MATWSEEMGVGNEHSFDEMVTLTMIWPTASHQCRVVYDILIVKQGKYYQQQQTCKGPG